MNIKGSIIMSTSHNVIVIRHAEEAERIVVVDKTEEDSVRALLGTESLLAASAAGSASAATATSSRTHPSTAMRDLEVAGQATAARQFYMPTSQGMTSVTTIPRISFRRC